MAPVSPATALNTLLLAPATRRCQAPADLHIGGKFAERIYYLKLRFFLKTRVCLYQQQTQFEEHNNNNWKELNSTEFSTKCNLKQFPSTEYFITLGAREYSTICTALFATFRLLTLLDSRPVLTTATGNVRVRWPRARNCWLGGACFRTSFLGGRCGHAHTLNTHLHHPHSTLASLGHWCASVIRHCRLRRRRRTSPFTLLAHNLFSRNTHQDTPGYVWTMELIAISNTTRSLIIILGRISLVLL